MKGSQTKAFFPFHIHRRLRHNDDGDDGGDGGDAETLHVQLLSLMNMTLNAHFTQITFFIKSTWCTSGFYSLSLSLFYFCFFVHKSSSLCIFFVLLCSRGEKKICRQIAHVNALIFFIIAVNSGVCHKYEAQKQFWALQHSWQNKNQFVLQFVNFEREKKREKTTLSAVICDWHMTFQLGNYLTFHSFYFFKSEIIKKNVFFSFKPKSKSIWYDN